jgi:hypothetical protein
VVKAPVPVAVAWVVPAAAAVEAWVVEQVAAVGVAAAGSGRRPFVERFPSPEAVNTRYLWHIPALWRVKQCFDSREKLKDPVLSSWD